MPRILVVASVVFCLACGGDAPEQRASKPAPQAAGADISENKAPVISAVEIHPSAPMVSDGLTASVQVQDPDRDAIEVELEWYRNGELIAEGKVMSLEPFQLEREDRIHVIAFASDGEAEVSGRSDVVEIVNSAPRVTSVKLTPEQPLASDLLEAEVESKDENQDRLTYKFRWLVGNEPIPDEEGPRLVASNLKRGQRVVVQVLANDGIEDSGGWVTSNPVAIKNAPPKIVTQPNYQLDAPFEYSYQMRAQDPDGDTPLKFDLVKGPPGMEVNAVSGLVSWRIQPGVSGKFPIELAVSDPFGAEVLQRYSLEMDWQTDSDESRREEQAQPANAAPNEEAEVEDTEDDDTEEFETNEDIDRSLIDPELSGDDEETSFDDESEDDDEVEDEVEDEEE